MNLERPLETARLTLFVRSLGKPKRRESEVEKIYKLGWSLFLLAKGKLLTNPGDFVQCLHLLLGVMNLLVVHVPESVRKISLKEILGNAPSSRQRL